MCILPCEIASAFADSSRESVSLNCSTRHFNATGTEERTAIKMPDKTENVILEVEKNPVLYDKSRQDYKEAEKKKDVWDAIGKRLGLTGKEVDARWKNVRDNYVKFLKKTKTKSGDGAKNIKPYKYARMLAFLTPFLSNRETASNLVDSDNEDDIPDHESTKETEEIEVTEMVEAGSNYDTRAEIASIASSATIKKSATKSRKRSLDDVDQTLCDYLKKKTNTTSEQPDEIDLFLKSMASTIRKLPAHKRADVRFEIHSIVHQAEMDCLYTASCPSVLPTTPYYGNEEAPSMFINPGTGQTFAQL